MSKCLYCRIDGQMVVGAAPSPSGLLLATGPEHALRKLVREVCQASFGGWHLRRLAEAHLNADRANQVVAEFLAELRTKVAGTRISLPDRVPAWNKHGWRA